MNKLKKIDNIMFRVKDLNKSESFYINTLGMIKAWEDLEVKMIGFTFPESDSEIVIHSNSELPKFDFSFLVDDVVGFCKDFSKVYKVAFGPIEVRPGMYAVLSDLDGNKLPIIDLTKFDGKPRYDK